MTNTTETKYCRKCEDWKPLDAFNNLKRAKDGKQYVCRDCHNPVMNEYQKDHKPENKSRTKKWIKNNQEVWLASIGVWQKKNPAHTAAYGANRRAKELGVTGKLKGADVKALFDKQGSKCASCGKKCRLTVDHIIPFKHPLCVNDIRNIQGLCKPCNSTKHDKIADYIGNLTEYPELLMPDRSFLERFEHLDTAVDRTLLARFDRLDTFDRSLLATFDKMEALQRDRLLYV